MAAIGEFARRPRPGLDGEFAADELASELHMSQQGAAGQMEFASRDVAKRLPKTFAALAAGQIHPIHLRIVEDETRILSGCRRRPGRRVPGPGRPRHDVRGSSATPPRKLVLKPDPTRSASGRKPPSGGARAPVPGRSPATPGSSPASSLRMRRPGSPGSTSSSAPWTWQRRRLASPAPCRTSGSGLTLICCKNVTAAPSLPGWSLAASGEGGQDQPASDQPPPNTDPPGPDPTGPDGPDGPNGSDGPGKRSRRP